MNIRRIVIDGKTYNSVDEMPEDVRKRYEQAISSLKDQNQNAIPDVLENNIPVDNDRNGIPDILENTPGAPIFARAMKILVDGKEFKSIDELPPEARAKYEKAMGMLDANRNGIPDFLEGKMDAQQSAAPVSTSIAIETPRPTSPSSISVEPTITPDTTNGWMLALLGVVLLLVCLGGVAGVWYFFLR
jgi:hypothetical protein